jgi:uncharacterized membrane protein required for colicin V production
MSWLDLAALVVVVLAAFDGAKNGLVWAALETVLVVATAAATRTLSPHVEPYVGKIADFAPENRAGAAHVVVLATTAAVLGGVLVLLKPATRGRRFARDGYFGGALGAVNGLFASLLVLSVVIWPARPVDVEDPLAKCRLVPAIEVAHGHGLAWFFPTYLPARLAELRRP